MEGLNVKRVECLTCGSHHNYRAPKAVKAAVARAAKPKAAAAGPRKTTASATIRAEAERAETWEKAVSGKLSSEFRPFNITSTFADGDLVSHKKFGDGVVVEVHQEQKVSILFREGLKLLAHAG